MQALAKFAGVKLFLVNPCSEPFEFGRLGVLSPSKNGNNTSPSDHGFAESERFAKSSSETFNVAAPALITRAAFSVQANGK